MAVLIACVARLNGPEKRRVIQRSEIASLAVGRLRVLQLLLPGRSLHGHGSRRRRRSDSTLHVILNWILRLAHGLIITRHRRRAIIGHTN